MILRKSATDWFLIDAQNSRGEFCASNAKPEKFANHRHLPFAPHRPLDPVQVPKMMPATFCHRPTHTVDKTMRLLAPPTFDNRCNCRVARTSGVTKLGTFVPKNRVTRHWTKLPTSPALMSFRSLPRHLAGRLTEPRSDNQQQAGVVDPSYSASPNRRLFPNPVSYMMLGSPEAWCWPAVSSAGPRGLNLFPHNIRRIQAPLRAESRGPENLSGPPLEVYPPWRALRPPPPLLWLTAT
jgi:hypothetical protein